MAAAWLPRGAHCAALLALAAPLFSAGHGDATPRLQEDFTDVFEADACPAGDAACALSLRQLRATGGSEAALQATIRPEDGLPGGWGEAAVAVREVLAADGVRTPLRAARATDAADHRLSGSCAEYNCSTKANASQGCQCHTDCWWHYNCCSDYRPFCLAGRNVSTLYHQTSPQAGPLILANGFRIGKHGWCSGAIYFAKTPADTDKKAIGPESAKGFIIEAEVDVGRVYEMSPACQWNGTAEWLNSTGHDSISFDPGDGPEVVIYDKARVISTRIYIG